MRNFSAIHASRGVSRPANERLPVATPIRIALTLLMACLAGGCGVASLPAAFGGGEEVDVRELRRLDDCGRDDIEPAVRVLADDSALRDWQAARGIDLIGEAPLLPGPYAVIDHGARPGGGYGLVVSRRAVEAGLTLRLTASFLMPKADSAASGLPTRPCVLVQVPPGEYTRIEVADPSGRRRAFSPVDAPRF